MISMIYSNANANVNAPGRLPDVFLIGGFVGPKGFSPRLRFRRPPNKAKSYHSLASTDDGSSDW